MAQMRELFGDDLPLDPYSNEPFLFSISESGIPIFSSLGQDQAAGGADPLDRDMYWLASEEQEGRPEMKEKLQDVVRSWGKDLVDAEALLASMLEACPDATPGEIDAALEAVARGEFSAASVCAAAALCVRAGIGDPVERASELYNSDANLTDPQWVVWVASSSFGWILNSGLSACYYEFEEAQYRDRIRAFEVIGAEQAAAVMREADAAFGEAGPPPVEEDRSQYRSDEAAGRLQELGPKFWACDDEVSTRRYLYALENREDFLTSEK